MLYKGFVLTSRTQCQEQILLQCNSVKCYTVTNMLKQKQKQQQSPDSSRPFPQKDEEKEEDKTKQNKKRGGGGGEGADYEDQVFLVDRIVLLWGTQLPQTLAAECQTRTGGKVEVVEKDDRWDQANFRARHRQTGHRSPRPTPGGTLRRCKLAAGVPQRHMGGPWIPLCTGRQLPSALCVGHQRE